MADFPHLRLDAILTGVHRPSRTPQERITHPTTQANLGQGRADHGATLRRRVDQLEQRWTEIADRRNEAGLPPLPDSIPLFLQIDPNAMDPDSLRKSFGIEVIAVEEDGFIIGASAEGSDFKSLKAKIDKFIKTEGKFKDTAARLWRIETGEPWRVEHILSPELREKWDSIGASQDCIVDISVSCSLYVSDCPSRKTGETEDNFDERLSRWRDRKVEIERKRDDLASARQAQLADIVSAHGGTFLSSAVDSGDSFGVRVKLSGAGLKDLVLNFPFLFDVTENDPFAIVPSPSEGGQLPALDFASPSASAPVVCVIDSGIQEGHRYLAAAIRNDLSRSYLPLDQDTDDKVVGGHGTRVAGAVLFQSSIPTTGSHQHVAWLANARVLDGQRIMPSDIYPPQLMTEVVLQYQPECRLFNLSVNARRSCRTRHMSDWAASIDSLSWDHDIVFIVSAGNIQRETGHANNPGVRDLIRNGHGYPTYFAEPSCKIANPAQSAFALTVGSICLADFNDQLHASFGKLDEPSAFSRSGPGLWGMVKPDVTEYGGDYVRETGPDPLIIIKRETSPETTRTTSNGQSARGRDDVGTSYSAPKVSHTLARILSEWPTASSLFMRALVAQSARWPMTSMPLTDYQKLTLFGYGLPIADRALDNSAHRITFVAEDQIKPKAAHVYKVDIPYDLRRPGDSYVFLVEVTLAYKARIRRTRRGTKSYVSSWVDWMSSKLGESDDAFRARAVKHATSAQDDVQSDAHSIQWTIREKNGWGSVKDMKRNDSTLQKDWVRIVSHDLPDHISVAVVGHQGWEKDIDAERAPYCLLISIECLGREIEVYELIRLHNRAEVEV